MSKSLSQILVDRPDLNWFSSDVANLSEETALETILAYGQWEDVEQAVNLVGKKNLKNVYLKVRNKPRSILSHKTKSYFDLFFGLTQVK